MTDIAPRLFCFGLGFSAAAFARRVMAQGWSVAGTSRSAEKAGALRDQGIDAFIFDRSHALPPHALRGATHILVSVPPDDEGDPVLDLHGEDLAALPGLAWLGYLSTTGIYGDHGGGWVDETTPLSPNLARSRRRALADQAWQDLAREHNLPVHIFRLAGIYGPGRSPLDNVRAGTAQRILRPGQVFSRIHVEDIATVLQASIKRPHPGRIYNVCDNEPAEPAEVVSFACQLLGVDPPPLIPYDQAELSPMARTFWADNKRVRNTRIIEELGVTLAYPSYREGLRAIKG